MEFVTLTKKEFDGFSNNYKDKCYLQSSNIAEFRKTQGWHTEYVGVKENSHHFVIEKFFLHSFHWHF